MKLKLSTLSIIVMIFWLTGCAGPSGGGPTPALSYNAPPEIMTPIPFPNNTPVLTRHREGGIAGFCDDVTIYANGAFKIEYCKGKIPTRSGQFSPDQLARFAAWVNTFKSFEAGGNDNLTSFPDQMFAKTTFKGAGQTQASLQDIIVISEFAASLVTQPPPDAAIKAREFLANELGISADQITIVYTEAVEWPDSCLGLGQPDEICAQVITPGYRVVLEAQGQMYQLQTDKSGEIIRKS